LCRTAFNRVFGAGYVILAYNLGFNLGIKLKRRRAQNFTTAATDTKFFIDFNTHIINIKITRLVEIIFPA